MSEGIPILDAGGLMTADRAAHAQFGKTFCAAFADTGFAYLENHGIADDIVADVMHQNSRFHALPNAEKQAVALDRNHRGYIGPGTSTDRASTLARVTQPNQSESFMLMREDSSTSSAVLADEYLAGPNQWPRALPGFRSALNRYVDAMSALARTILGSCDIQLGDSRGAMLDDFNPATTWLRLLRYPGTPANTDQPLIGSAPHHDFGAITLLAQDDVGGLEVMLPTGRWIEVEPVAGTFIVNAGEMLRRYSGDRLRATPHRVINRSASERFSVAFFYDPNMNATVKSLITRDAHTPHPPEDAIRFDSFVRNALTQSYDKHAK